LLRHFGKAGVVFAIYLAEASLATAFMAEVFDLSGQPIAITGALHFS